MRVFKRRNFVIVVDVVLLLIILLLLSPRLTGLPLHEILGTIVCIPVTVHLLNSWQWIRSTSKKIFTTAKLRTRINYLLNTILFILVIIVIVSGLFISEIVVPATGINLIKDRAWGTIHTQTTTFVILFSGLHIAVNLDWILALFKKRLRIPAKTVSAKPNNIMQIIKRISILTFVVLIISFALIVVIGMPKIERIYKHSFIKEYTPTLKNGLGQFLGETFFIVVIAFIGRK